MGFRGPRALAAAIVLVALASSPALAAQKPKTPPATQKPKPKPATKPAVPARPETKAPAPPPGLTMRTSYTAGDGQASETTLLSNGTRQRVDLGGGVAVITQCDTKQTIQVNDNARVYVALPFDAAQSAPVNAPSAKRGGAIEYASVITPSTERKDLFGLNAQHVTTVITKTPSPTACDKKKERMQTDGWYAAVPVSLSCAAPQPAQPAAASECRDESRTTTAGAPPAGVPLAYTTTTYGDDGKETASVRMEVKELSIAPVDASLLDAPASYTKAKDATEFVAAVERAANEARWGAPKAAGVTRIGIVMPTNKTSEAISMDAVEAELLESLTTAPFEAIPLKGSTPAQLETEAKGRECDYVVALDLAMLKSTAPSKVGGLLRKASGGGSPAELHESRVDYRLSTPGATPVTKSASAKTGAFTWKRALGVARFAARLYFGASAGMLRMMMAQSGGMGVPAQGADPSLNAVSWVLNVVGGGTPAPIDEASRDAAIAASIHNAAADIMKDLAARRK
jgi:hypothetical protein